MTTTSKELLDFYKGFYSNEIEKWRYLGAVGKVNNILKLKKGILADSIIEIGAGDGSVLQLLNKAERINRLVAVEISESGMEQIKSKQIPDLKEVKLFNGYDLPYGDKEFDIALCTHVIEHVEHPRQLLSEIRRISKHQIFEVPIDYSSRLRKKFDFFMSYGHINIFTPSIFDYLLYTCKLNITKRKYSMFSISLIWFQFKKKPIALIKRLIHYFLFLALPWLRKRKPNTYTVLCSDN